MTIFYYTLFSTYLIALADRVVNQRYKKRNFYVFTIFVASIFILVAGLRNTIGDTEMYIHSFNTMPHNLSEVITQDTKDKAFVFFTYALKQIHDDSQFFIMITALITNLLNILILRKYGSLFELQVWLYVTTGYFLVTMNGVRQAMVAALVFWATKYIIEGQFWKYALFIIVASTFHASAIILIPIYFIVRLPMWSRETYIILGLSILVFLLWGELLPVFQNLLGNTQYGEYNAFLAQSDQGANPIRAIISFVPVVLAYFARNILQEKVKYANIFVNMTVINFLIMVFSMYNWIFARFTIYFQLYVFILFPLIIQYYFPKKVQKFVYLGFLVLYFLLFYYEHVLSLNIKYTSKFF